ncbi:MAG: hypothetical protein FGM15_00540 [Chthoniobacterales bacterium]|nr:hypothetical protein [Chthoniobacterales bacterium]
MEGEQKPAGYAAPGLPRKKRVLFICSGNYYRSRLAEILFNAEASAAGLAWEAESRGLLQTGELKGISEHVVSYLRGRGMESAAGEPRDPLALDVEDLTEADLVVALCRAEHQPMIEQKFLALAKALHKAGRIRYWNVYDVPGRPRILVRMLGGGHRGPSQPPDSGTDHIALSVRDLAKELGAI